MIALLLAAAAAAAEPPPAPRAEVVKLDDGMRADVTLDGPILGWVVARRAGEERRVLVLAGPPEPKKEGTPCKVSGADPAPPWDARLFAWDPKRPDAIVPVGSGLPRGALRAVDLEGDAIDEVVLYGDDGIFEVAVELDARTTTARLAVPGRAAPIRGASEERELRGVTIGAMTTYRRAEDGALRAVGEVELPVRVDPWVQSVRVGTLGVRALGRHADGRMRLATSPEPIGVERIRTLVLDPEGPAEARTVEAWAKLPGRERALERDVLTLDGEPVLLVMTMDADKLSLFGEKRLRLYRLAPDRTRTGVAPLLAVETGINLWQRTVPVVTDLDADGRQDLALVYWKGLKDTIAAIEVRRRAPDGSFGPARTLDFDVPEGDRGFIAYGHDLDGDSRPDLVVRSEGALLVYPGSPPERAIERPVGKTPSRRIALPDGIPSGTQSVEIGSGGFVVRQRALDLGVPDFADLDGDGRVEAVFAGTSGEQGRFVVVRPR